VKTKLANLQVESANSEEWVFYVARCQPNAAAIDNFSARRYFSGRKKSFDFRNNSLILAEDFGKDHLKTGRFYLLAPGRRR
jgi:hypothetical protein